MKITDGNYVDEKDADMAYTYDNTEAEYIKGAYTSLSNRPIAGKEYSVEDKQLCVKGIA